MTAPQLHDRVAVTLTRGAVAGLVGAAVMTAFQKAVEMPISGRDDSYAPAELAMKVLRIGPMSPAGRYRLNYLSHFAVGAGWGAGRAAASRAGLHGQAAVAATFAILWTADVVGVAALGLDDLPWRWSRGDVIIDVIDKLVLAEATNLVFERLDRRASAG